MTAALLITNAVDEKLSTQARAMLAPPQSRHPDSENLFVLLAGLDAPADKSPLETGEGNIAAYRRVVTEHLPLQGVSPDDVGRTPRSARLTVTRDLSQWNMLSSSIAVANTPAQQLGSSLLKSPSHISLPRKESRVGLCIDLFEACSAFTRVTACTLALSPYFVTRIPKASATSLPP
jgi:hypothetical protein